MGFRSQQFNMSSDSKPTCTQQNWNVATCQISRSGLPEQGKLRGLSSAGNQLGVLRRRGAPKKEQVGQKMRFFLILGWCPQWLTACFFSENKGSLNPMDNDHFPVKKNSQMVRKWFCHQLLVGHTGINPSRKPLILTWHQASLPLHCTDAVIKCSLMLVGYTYFTCNILWYYFDNHPHL